MKKSLLLSILCVLCAARATAQCNVDVTINQFPADCTTGLLGFMGYAISDCSIGGTYDYTWSAYTTDQSGSMNEIPELTQSGNAISGTVIPQYSPPIPLAWELYAQICLSVSFVDVDGIVQGEGSYCWGSVQMPQPIVVTASLGNNSCGQASCLAQFMASGGSAPYTYLLSNGQVLTQSTWTCFDVPGTYILTAIDANGCEGSTQFTVNTSGPVNNSCENAEPLENGVILQDTLCTLNQEVPACGNGAMSFQSGWYSFNSENFQHANIAFYSGYNTSPGGTNGYFGPSTYEIYQESATGGCDGAELVFCHSSMGSSASGGISQGAPSCFDLADSIAIQPNTTYYIKYYSYWTSWVPLQALVMLTNEPIAPICGCTDNTSCNYDPDAFIPNGSCGWSGCMDQGACNYQSWVTCDNGSCIFGSNINGLIFHDLNGDGTRQTFQPAEPVLSNIGVITIEELGVLIYPDASGQFVLPDIPQATYTVSFEDPNGYWILNGASSIQVTLPTCNGLNLPLIPSSEATAQISGLSIWGNSTIHCAGGFNPGIYVYNNGNTPLNGTFTMTYDASLNYDEATLAGTAVTVESPVATVPGTLTWTIDNQPPGSVYYYMVHILGPGAATVGQSFPFAFSLTLVDASGAEFYTNDWSVNPTVTCSYDPNDKQATPAGWTEQHFITAGQDIEYRIRFQNTGNAPAFDVRIDDQLDIEHLDLSSFTPIAASHSYSTVVNPDGFVQFVFNNIMLPDSVHDEPNSHGWVVYRIRAFDTLQPLDVIQNSASIYFDDNDPVITNTYSHTIFSCDLIPDPNSVDATCQNQPVWLNIFPELDYTETYNWSIEGNQVGNEVYYNFPAGEPGSFDIVLNRTNPFCNEYDTLNVEVWPVPDNTLTYEGSVPMFMAPPGTSWQWLFNGEQMVGETSQSLVVSETGSYSVITSNEFGCTTLSEELPFFVIGVQSDELHMSHVYPNPTEGTVNIQFADGVHGVRVINSLGQQIFADAQARGLYQFDCSSWSSGVYRVEFGKGEGITLIVR